MSECEFIEAYEAHWAKIYRYCLFRTNSRQEAEDLTAEVFRKLLESRKQPGLDELLPWLFRVARNLCVNHHHRKSRLSFRELITGHAEEPAAEDRAGGWRDPELLEAVRSLKPREQQILFMRVFEDLTFSEIGRALDISESAAKVAFHRGTRNLRRQLEKQGESVFPSARAGQAPLFGIDQKGETYGR